MKKTTFPMLGLLAMMLPFLLISATVATATTTTSTSVVGLGHDRAFRSGPAAVASEFLAASIPSALARLFGGGGGGTVAGESEGLLPRTFGRIRKKITLGLLPVMFKLGIMTMVIFAILLLAAKGVFISSLLLIINLGFILAKLIAWKKYDHSEGHQHHQGWAPQLAAHNAANDIHLHIHNAAPAIYPVAQHHDLPYGGYSQRGPSIHIDAPAAPASSYGIGGGGGSDGGGWGGYQRRQQLGNEYAYVDAATSAAGAQLAAEAGSGVYYPQQRPVYIPNTRYN